jgi:hypothetical protein
VAIGFLKGAAVELARGDIAGNGEVGNRVKVSVCKTYGNIGGAGTAGGKRCSRTAGNPIVDVRHESRHRLVTDRIGSNFCGSLVERVDETDVAVAAEAERMSNVFLDQIVNDNLAAVHPSQSITPLGPSHPE